MRILCAGGRSGGHVTPVVAVLDEVESLVSEPVEVCFVCDKPFEQQSRTIMKGAPMPVDVKVITAGKFRRYANFRFVDYLTTPSVILKNIAAYIEGSDTDLKKEYVIFSAHIDHIGESARGINAGADDNATGCAALLSLAEAFNNLNKKPLRSVMFLWVSGEEIGLFGSKSYVDNPLVPLENTIVDLNMDMIGRIKGVADTSADNPMTGPKEVFIITGNQSSELMDIAEEIDKGTVLDFDYSLSGRKHPLQLFARSDHYNFVRHDIPVLFFTTGLHTDYHTPGDVTEKIDFKKLELITETVFQLGYTVANRKTRLEVDNPFSSW